MLDVYFGPPETRLHGILLSSETSGAPAAIICHPHPKFGGSMHNNVVLAVEAALADAGITTLRFNFRGVGRSAGYFDNGVGEKNDVLHAIDFLSGDATVGSVHLVGYSFGALVGMNAAAADDRIKSITGIAPPTALGSFSFLRNCSKPVLAITGSQDQFCDVENLRVDVESCGGALQIIPGADHFFINIEDKAALPARDFIMKNS